MTISAAALPFLILAVALGPPIHGSRGDGPLSLNHGLQIDLLKQNPSIMGNGGVHRPGDCCFSYTPRNIRCLFMEDYFLTTSGCSKPAVIFRTKGGQRVCADPSREEVQDCVNKLASANTGKRLLEEKLQ
ncbi:C-C motif chemokine 4 [Desmodus rotundus]|uniref:C-C motif chemokine 4 n=1 Tax=Desmodus rotundus TaxID=9430 RepID=UPI0023817672|nr:C-C motif chemokine 4 [Desmodus rotundus]